MQFSSVLIICFFFFAPLHCENPNPSNVAEVSPLFFIDPAHGGGEQGVNMGKFSESRWTLNISLKMQQLARDQGLEMELSRKEDEFLEISDRVGRANRSGARAFVNLHVNYSFYPGASGFRVFYPAVATASQKQLFVKWNSAAALWRNRSRLLGEKIAEALKQGKVFRRDVQSLKIPVFNGLNLPAVVVETGHASNPDELKSMIQDETMDRLAQNLLDGLKNFLREISGND